MTDRPVGEALPAEPQLEDPTLRLIHHALAGRQEALSRLVDRLTPVIQARVARSMIRNQAGFQGTDPREQVRDLTQEVFLSLFKNAGETLRRWHPEGGASLENFVGLVAERKVISELRRATARATEELPENLESLTPCPEADPERRAHSSRLLQNLVSHFRRELSPLGWTMFELLFIWEGSVQEVSDDLDMKPEAVRKWRTRLRGLARRWADKKTVTGVHHG